LDWFRLAQDRDRLQAVVNTWMEVIMKLCFFFFFFLIMNGNGTSGLHKIGEISLLVKELLASQYVLC
jgi:hypothetical protein